MKGYRFTYVLIFFSAFVFGQSEGLFDKGVAAYNDGKYSEAIGYYEDVIKSGVHSEAVYFNLGNCYYKLNQTAPSIYYYEKALLLDPDDAEIENNLAFAKQMILDSIEELPQTGLARLSQNISNVMTYEQWGMGSIIFIFLAVFSFILYYFLSYSNYKRVALISSMVSVLLGILFFAFAYSGQQSYFSDQPAIVFAEEITVRSEPNRRSEPVFELHEGTKVQVLDQLEDWHKIQLVNGQEGWLQVTDIRLLKDF
ncbi:MAG: tetratricopeptide repeat protein [Bacteroidia bacterium]|nr:tetratricopeptide repeat protein [Bacteroidia bacterium]